MSKYTYQLRDILESKLNRNEYVDCDDVDSVVNATVETIFSQSRNWLTDEPYVSNLQLNYFNERFFFTVAKMVLRHYYLREISSESVGLWLLWLNKKVIKIAEKYDPWYASIVDVEHLSLNKLEDIHKLMTYDSFDTRDKTWNGLTYDTDDIDTTIIETDNVSGSDTGSDNNKSAVNLYPQSNLTGNNDYYSGIEKNNSSNSDNYTDNKSRNEHNTVANVNNYNSNSENHLSDNHSFYETTNGIKGNYADIIKRFKASIHNVDVKLVDEFKDLFLNIY